MFTVRSSGSANSPAPADCSNVSPVTRTGGRTANSLSPRNTYFGVLGVKSAMSFWYTVRLGASTNTLRTPWARYRYAAYAPISRVLPTPVARAKHTDGKSRSKSVTPGYNCRTAASAAPTSVPIRGGSTPQTAASTFSDR